MPRWIEFVFTTAFAALLSAFVAGSAAALDVKKTTLVTIPATFEVAVPIAKAWALASSVDGFCALAGFIPDPAAKTKAFAKVGDSLPATMWTDKGTLIATMVTKGKELRVAWEPENAAYLCGKRIVLSPAGDGTKIEYWDRYTDDQANVDETAAVVTKETEAGVTKFKLMAEK